MWEVIVGGVLAIAGGFLGNLHVNYQTKKEKAYNKQVEVYKQLLSSVISYEKYIIDTKNSTAELKYIENKIDIFASKNVVELWNKYKDLVNKSLLHEISDVDYEKERENIRVQLKERIRNERGVKYGNFELDPRKKRSRWYEDYTSIWPSF